MLSDYQALFNSLASEETTNKSIKMLKTDLNTKIRTTGIKITIKWIRAHMGFPGNKYTDELAKMGTSLNHP